MAAKAPHPPILLDLVEWTDASDDFGGISGLQMTDNGTGCLAVSDGGFLFSAKLVRDAEGRITTIEAQDHERFIDNLGRPAIGFQSDAEALRIERGGSILVAFEGYARVARFELPDMHPLALQVWDRFKSIWGNAGMEALSVAPDGQIMTILENSTGDGAYQTFVYQGGIDWVNGPALASDGRFRATDSVYGPDGRLYVLERSFSPLWGYTTRISAYRAAGKGFSQPEVVLQTGAGEFGDLEGLDVWTDSKGRTIATMVTDNNFLPFVPTKVAEFVLSE